MTYYGLPSLLAAIIFLNYASIVLTANYQYTCEQVLDDGFNGTESPPGKCWTNLGKKSLNFNSKHLELIQLIGFKKFHCLMGDRMLIGRDVAAYKWKNKIPILDLKREEKILEMVVSKAKQAGLSTSWASKFFNDQMTANRAVQQNLIQLWKRNDTSPDEPIDLIKEIRPKIDRINRQLIELALATGHFRSSEWCLPITEYELPNVDAYCNFDLNESYIFEIVATRNVCQYQPIATN